MYEKAFLTTALCMATLFGAAVIPGVSVPAYAGEVTYSEEFFESQGYAVGTPQVDNWLAFREAVGADASSFIAVTLSGSQDPEGVSCTDPAVVQELATAFAAGTALSVVCDGRPWTVSQCGTGVEINANGGVCQCPSPGYTARPTIRTDMGNNPNWGGLAGVTCRAPSQTITVSFTAPEPEVEETPLMTLQRIREEIAALPKDAFNRKGSRKKLVWAVSRVMRELKKAESGRHGAHAKRHLYRAARKLDRLLERLDGCELREVADSKRRSRYARNGYDRDGDHRHYTKHLKTDRITDCGDQQYIYKELMSVRKQLP